MRSWPLTLICLSFFSACGSAGQVQLGTVNFNCSRSKGPCTGIETPGTLAAVVLVTASDCEAALWNDGKYVAAAPVTITLGNCTSTNCTGSVSEWFSPGNTTNRIISVPKATYNTCVIVDTNEDANIGNSGDLLATPI